MSDWGEDEAPAVRQLKHLLCKIHCIYCFFPCRPNQLVEVLVKVMEGPMGIVEEGLEKHLEDLVAEVVDLAIKVTLHIRCAYCLSWFI